MDNTFIDNLENATNYKETENGALAHKTTRDVVYDMFALGGAYRHRSEADCIFLFKKAFDEQPLLAMKCLFYLRDVRGGQGERRFFRVCFKWLCENAPAQALKNLANVSEYGRWDDLLYTAADTPIEEDAFEIIKHQLALDLQCKTPSLLGKWLPSENASAYETKKMASKIRKYLGMTHKQYRKVLASLRAKINIVERLMSENRWNDIEFDKIPSRAGLIYKNAFARRDLIAQKYKEFIKDENTKVNAKTLYPYDVVRKALDHGGYGYDRDKTDRAAIEKYWNNLPDYLNGEPCRMMCVVDTSGSMTCGSGVRPIDVAISLGMYCAERVGGPFKNYYISFASEPQLIKIDGIDFVDKVERIYKTNLVDNTNLVKAFDLIYNMALKSDKKDIPNTLIVISDMEIDDGTSSWGHYENRWTEDNAATEMEKVRAKWQAAGLEMPKLIYWNVDARNDTILDLGSGVSLVSGASPIILEQVLTGVTGYDLMMKKLNSERYNAIQI